jgi:hypothetical protein
MFSKRLKSDVLVTSRIGWRSYQEHLTVRELAVRVLTPELPVFTTDAVVEFTVAGSLSPHFHGESRWRPLIENGSVLDNVNSPPFGPAERIEIYQY